MEEFKPEISVKSLPAADVSMLSIDSTITSKYVYPVKRPVEYENDFLIQVKASEIRKIRKKLNEKDQCNFPFHEVLLGVSSITFGAFISALITGVELNFSIVSIVAYIVCPVITAGTFVAYYFNRKINNNSIEALVETILDLLVDPDNAS